MTDSPALPAAARRYLETLELRAASLPEAHRAQLVEQIAEHLEAAVADGDSLDETLARLGSPQELVDAADGRLERPARSVDRRATIATMVGVVALVLGALLVVCSIGMIALTGRWRSIVIAIPAMALLIPVGALLLTWARRRRRQGRTS
ncbi:HAAS signaling domain-containing protein [Agrococcus carbonis]|uniref:Uncharacterized protein n=1 Tax=Agrococcus carbonis TaxID=684552 RepID=A0A1H1L5P2_9MICO|nr:hypothetical protein [Agrococcus carbonis]SDR69239.1 hypothetical protein SAMN04489719_0402 [Agrococcus carbonis]